MRVLLLAAEPRADLLATVAHALPGAAVRQLPPGRDPGGVVRDVDPHVVLLAPCLADHGGAGAVLEALREHDHPLVIALSEAGDPRVAVALLKAGLHDWLPLADAPRRLADAARGAGPRRPPKRASPARGQRPAVPALVGTSAALDDVHRAIEIAADSDVPVLIEGETGTGKDVVARRIHALGSRCAGPFVPVNCAAIPEALAESELFGHARGAFTGAVQDRPGALVLADHGTLFLDELEDLPPPLQAKLLRVVQDGEVRPVGATTTRRVSTRILAASNRDLAALVEEGRFRSDLYYRLQVLSVRLPPLRERREDVLALAEHFIHRFNAKEGTSHRLPPAAECRPLVEHTWPGNVRELENTIEALLLRARAARRPLADMLRQRAPCARTHPDERTRLLRVLEANRWNRQRAATALGISRVTLWRRMERHGLRELPSAPSNGATAQLE